jgi:hypothetical protein
MTDPFLATNPANEMISRAGNSISVGVFHRTGNAGNDTAIGEANYSHQHAIQASFYKVVDAQGKVYQVTLPKDTEYAVADPILNEKSLNYELTGVNGTALTDHQISTVIADIKADPATKTIPNHRLSLNEILAIHSGRKIAGLNGGWCTHKDITLAVKAPGMTHTDYISEAEIKQILTGVYA